ncbi:MAG: hypothetical protein KDD04_03275 [Sinomicrobium sp.]|nr:hypothetical protein [Sinomicrobium sp.]
MKEEEQKNLDTTQKLMLLQGITLIHDGLQFIEWAEKMPNELAYDFFMILTDRFQMFRESVLDGSMDNLIIDRIKNRTEDLKHGYALNRKIQEQLNELREIAIGREQERKKQ